MLKSLFFILMVLSSFVAWSQDDEATTYKKIDYQITDKFKAGSNLIFNCQNSYYTCVDNDSYSLCQEMRAAAIEKKLAVYPCAPLKSFPTKTQCAQKNYEVVESLAKKRFCYPKN